MFAARMAQWATRLTATIAVVGLMTGVPWSLVVYIGWPLPRQLPASGEDLQQLLTTPVTDEVVINLLAVAAWILWAAFAISLAAEAAAQVRGVHTPRLPGLQPMQVLAGWLLSGITAGMLAASPLATTGAGHADISSPPAVRVQAPAMPPGADSTAQPAAIGGSPVTAAAVAVLPAGQVTVLVAGQQHQYTVGKGDTLWDIAEAWLGDPTRWPEIWQLNQGNSWPQVSGQVQFSDPDLIYPNWVLTLPDDASPPGPESVPTDPPVEHIPPADDPPAEPDNLTPAPVGPPEPPTSPGTNTPPPATPSPAATLDPDEVVPPPPGATPPGTLTAEPAPSPSAGPPASPSPEPGTDEHPDDEEPAGRAPAGGDPSGVALPDGSWLPWVVAAAIASAMAVVWLQRQRRLQPRPLDAPHDDGGGGIQPTAEEPEVVRSIRRAVHTNPRLDDEGQEEAGTTPETPESPAAPEPTPAGAPVVPGIEPLPAGGMGLVGPGAEAAARGALVAALAAGDPTDPDARTEVVIPADTLVTLLGAEAVTIGGWPRLHVADNLDAALTHVEARLLATARLLDEYEVSSLDALYRVSPGERPVPPLLLVAATPPPGIRMRTRTVLGLGGEERIRGLLLGGWGHGPTVHVEPDGTCHPEGAHSVLPDGTPARMPVLATTPAFKLLQTLREAHTGQPPSPPPTPPAGGDKAGSDRESNTADSLAVPAVDDENTPAAAPTGAEPDQPADAGPVQTSASAPAAGEASQAQGPGIAAALPKAIVQVLGPPQILNADTARPVRAVAWELLAYLAVHRDGATPEQIEEDLWPRERRRVSAPRLHTTVSNLRHALASAAGADPGQAEHYLRKHHGRYQLCTVEVDLWQLNDASQEEKEAADAQQRLAALRRACDAYHGDLGGDHDYDWVNSHRHHTRDLALKAHTTLAGLVAGQHPDEAARLLSQAARVAPLTEPVFQEAMRAYHRLGDAEAIRGLLRQLSRNLVQVGAEPSDETLELAASLRTDLQRRGD